VGGGRIHGKKARRGSVAHGASEQAVEVAKFLAHIGLKAIDEVAGERNGRTYVDQKASVFSLPVSET